MKKTFHILACITIFISCQKKSNAHENKMKNTDWLLGNWEQKTDVGTLSESWTKIDDSTYSGTSYFINLTNDTVHNEKIILKQVGENLSYIATVKGQNDDKPVTFNQTNVSENTMQFENLKHDYPQKIGYFKKGNRTIEAKISGVQKGKQSSETFLFSKK